MARAPFTATERRRRRKRRAAWAHMRSRPARFMWIEKPDGRVVPAANLAEWAVWYEHADRIVARDLVQDVEVSTVFLSIGALPFPLLGIAEDTPELYETMLFDREGSCGGPWRYATRAEALEGHAQVVAQVAAALAQTGGVAGLEVG